MYFKTSKDVKNKSLYYWFSTLKNDIENQNLALSENMKKIKLHLWSVIKVAIILDTQAEIQTNFTLCLRK